MRKISGIILCLMQCLQSQTTDCHRRSVIRPTIQLISHVQLSTSAGFQQLLSLRTYRDKGSFLNPVSSNSKFSLALRSITFTLRHLHLISLAIGGFATPTSAIRRRSSIRNTARTLVVGVCFPTSVQTRGWERSGSGGGTRRIGWGIVVAGVLNFRGGEDF